MCPHDRVINLVSGSSVTVSASVACVTKSTTSACRSAGAQIGQSWVEQSSPQTKGVTLATRIRELGRSAATYPKGIGVHTSECSDMEYRKAADHMAEVVVSINISQD